MAWETPVTNWTSSDGVTHADLNRIEENTLVHTHANGAQGGLIPNSGLSGGITAAKLSISSLASIAANLGAVTDDSTVGGKYLIKHPSARQNMNFGIESLTTDSAGAGSISPNRYKSANITFAGMSTANPRLVAVVAGTSGAPTIFAGVMVYSVTQTGGSVRVFHMGSGDVTRDVHWHAAGT